MANSFVGPTSLRPCGAANVREKSKMCDASYNDCLTEIQTIIQTVGSYPILSPSDPTRCMMKSLLGFNKKRCWFMLLGNPRGLESIVSPEA